MSERQNTAGGFGYTSKKSLEKQKTPLSRGVLIRGVGRVQRTNLHYKLFNDILSNPRGSTVSFRPQ